MGRRRSGRGLDEPQRQASGEQAAERCHRLAGVLGAGEHRAGMWQEHLAGEMPGASARPRRGRGAADGRPGPPAGSGSSATSPAPRARAHPAKEAWQGAEPRDRLLGGCRVVAATNRSGSASSGHRTAAPPGWVAWLPVALCHVASGRNGW